MSNPTIMETLAFRPATESLTCYCNGSDKYYAYNFGISKDEYDRLCLKYISFTDTFKNLKSFVGKNGKTYYSIKLKDAFPNEPCHARQVREMTGKKVKIQFEPKHFSFTPKGGIEVVSGTSFTLRWIEEVREAAVSNDLPPSQPKLVRS